jgi:hypothetical protein
MASANMVLIGSIYRVRPSERLFKAFAYYGNTPSKTFRDPHAAEKWIREEVGVHPVVKTECWPCKRPQRCEIWVQDT